MAGTVHYLNANNQFNGNGLAPGPAASNGAAGAKNAVSGFLTTAGDIYRVFRGTRYVAASAVVSAIEFTTLVGSAAFPTILEAYSNETTGEDDNTSLPRPIFDNAPAGNGTAGVQLRRSSHVIVRNVHAVGAAGSGGGGIRVWGTDNAEIYNCEFSENRFGVFVITDATTLAIDSVNIHDNDIHDNITGIGVQWQDATGAFIDNLSINANRVYANGLGPDGVGNVYGGITHTMSGVSTTSTNSDRGLRDMQCSDNEVYGNGGYGIAFINLRRLVKGCVASRNHVYDNNIPGLRDCHSMFFGAMFNGVVEDNVVHGNVGLKGSYSYGGAVGINMSEVPDQTCIGSNNVIRRNRVYDGDLSPTNVGLTANCGILLQNQQYSIVESNVVFNCRNGIVEYNTTGAVGAMGTNVIRNNTVDNIPYTPDSMPLSYYSGTGIYTGGGNDTTVYDNSVSNCGYIGLFVKSTITGYTEHHNSLYNTVNPLIVSAIPSTLTPGVLAPTDSQLNPALDANLMPTSASPLIGAGVHVGYAVDATARVQRWNPPTIGAYEYQRARVSRV